MTNTKYTVHVVQALAYKGNRKSLAHMLTHASTDGETALCGRLRPDSLCDQEAPVLTCPACLRKVAKLG